IAGGSSVVTAKRDGHRRPRFMAALRHDAGFRLFLAAIIPVSIVFSQFTGALPLFVVRNLGLSESEYGLLFTLNTLMIVTMEIPLSSRTAHWSHRRAMALGALTIGLGCGLFAFARSYIQVLGIIALWTVGEMILFPTMAVYTSDRAPEGQRGEYMGLYTMSFNLAFRLIGPWAGVVILERFGATPLWLGMLGAGLISAIMLGYA